MLFNVLPCLRQWHNFWLSKPFGLGMAGLRSRVRKTQTLLLLLRRRSSVRLSLTWLRATQHCGCNMTKR